MLTMQFNIPYVNDINRASSEIWGDSLCDYNCVDVSDDMHTISRLLLQGRLYII